MLIGIAAVAKNGAIGRDGKTPWRYPNDLEFFKKTTQNHVVVMGRKTFESIGKPLSNRYNIVISRTMLSRMSPMKDRYYVFQHPSTIMNTANDMHPETDVFIIGGSQVYEMFSNHVEKWIITRIPEEIKDADAFMPDDYLKSFEVVKTEDIGEGLIVEHFELRS